LSISSAAEKLCVEKFSGEKLSIPDLIFCLQSKCILLIKANNAKYREKLKV
jgi:hypothetical protein